MLPRAVELDMNPFTPTCPVRRGQTVYDRGGYEHEFDRALSDTEWLVFPLVEVSGWEGECELVRGERVAIMNPKMLYAKPPKPVVRRDIDEATQQLAALQEQLRTARADIRQFELEAKAREERILRHEKLKLLDDWIGGNITHLLHVQRFSPFKITEAKDETTDDGDRYSRKKKLKLLTLWGSSDGDLQWNIGQYSDASGGTSQIIPFGSYEAALDHVRAAVEAEFAAWLKDRTNAELNVSRTYTNAKTFNLPIPDEVEETFRLQRIASAQRDADRARDAFAQAAQKLNEARQS
jgi:hypothetical protein